MKRIYLVALNDGTDELYNLGDYVMTFHEGETAGDAWARMLNEDWEENWTEDDFEGGKPGYIEWMESRGYLPCLFNPSMAVSQHNAGDELFEDGCFLLLEDSIRVIEGLRQVKTSCEATELYR